MTADVNLNLPTGVWTGFFTEPHHTKRGWMHLYLQFTDGQILGEGTDYVGPWKLAGTYHAVEKSCQWTKQYLGKHQVVYRGQVNEHGIIGQWFIASWHSGAFHIWPSSHAEIYEKYADQE